MVKLLCIVEVGASNLDYNIIEKYYNQKKLTIVNSALIILNHIFDEQPKWKKELDTCSEYYINNFVLNNNLSKKFIRKYYRFFFEFQINDLLMREIYVSIFETIIDYKTLSGQTSKNGALLVGKVFLIAINLDKNTNSLEIINDNPKQIFDKLSEIFPNDSVIKNSLKEAKKELQSLMKKNLLINKKMNKFLDNEIFKLQFIPYQNRELIKPLYEVKLKYNIEKLVKYQKQEIDYVFEKEEIDTKLTFITYSLAAISMLKMIEKEKHVFFILSLSNSFFNKKKDFRNLLKLMSSKEYSSRIIIEIDSIILDKMAKDIEKCRKMGVLIAIRNGNSDLDPNDFDCIVITENQTKTKDIFKRFYKLGQITIISDIKDEEEQNKIDYFIKKEQKEFKDII